MKRRTLLKALSATGFASLTPFATFAVNNQSLSAPKNKLILPTHFDEIDHFNVIHRVRDGEVFPVPLPSRFQDVVVVGGGISGLTAIDRLQIEGVSCLLLEKESEVGGNSRRRKHGSVFYPLGAIVNQGPVAPFTGFFEELGVPFEAVQTPGLGYYAKGILVQEPFGKNASHLPFADNERKQFAQTSDWLTPYLHPQKGIFFPRPDNTPEIKALDKITLHEFFQQHAVDGELKRFLDILLSARLGEEGQNISAWTGLYLLSNLFRQTYTFPGGHGALSERLRERILLRDASAINTGFTTIKVQNRPGSKVWVTGIDAKGTVETIECRCAVMAVPKMVTKKLVEGLEKDRADLYNQFRYNAYLVAQVRTRPTPRPISSPTFEIACRDLFSRFIVAADWLTTNRDPQGRHFFTVYVPFPGISGRMALFHGSAEPWAKQILNDIQQVHPELMGSIEEIRLHRWGHPMVSPGPNMDAVLEQVREPFGNVVFAHSDTFGLCGLYSAVWTGMDAYSDVLLRLS